MHHWKSLDRCPTAPSYGISDTQSAVQLTAIAALTRWAWRGCYLLVLRAGSPACTQARPPPPYIALLKRSETGRWGGPGEQFRVGEDGSALVCFRQANWQPARPAPERSSCGAAYMGTAPLEVKKVEARVCFCSVRGFSGTRVPPCKSIQWIPMPVI